MTLWRLRGGIALERGLMIVEGPEVLRMYILLTMEYFLNVAVCARGSSCFIFAYTRTSKHVTGFRLYDLGDET